MSVTIGDSTMTWVELRPDTMHGDGRVVPRLRCRLLARTLRERMTVEVHLLRAELLAANEYVGEGLLTGERVYHQDTQLTLEIPLDRMALEYLDTIADGNQIDLTLRLSGWLHVRHDIEDLPRFEHLPAPGEWGFEAFGRGRSVNLPFRIPRSDWFTQVLEPLGTVQYICTEIAMPRGDHPLRASANHLHAAERALREGHDAQVFSRCHAAIEVMPGAPKDIYTGVGNEWERQALDKLLSQTKHYFHLGRHTADEGPQQGDFAVDHGDAAFALNLTKLLISHTARVLDRSA